MYGIHIDNLVKSFISFINTDILSKFKLSNLYCLSSLLIPSSSKSTFVSAIERYFNIYSAGSSLRVPSMVLIFKFLNKTLISSVSSGFTVSLTISSLFSKKVSILLYVLTNDFIYEFNTMFISISLVTLS